MLAAIEVVSRSLESRMYVSGVRGLFSNSWRRHKAQLMKGLRVDGTSFDETFGILWYFQGDFGSPERATRRGLDGAATKIRMWPEVSLDCNPTF